MKRNIKNILLHVLAASFFWGTVFHFALRKKADPLAAVIAGTDHRSYDRLEFGGFDGDWRSSVVSVSRFLWQHCGVACEVDSPALATLTFSGVDAGNVYYFLVDKDSNGRWAIFIAMQHYQHPGGYEQPVYRFPPAYYLERTVLKPDRSIGAQIEPKDDADDCDYVLQFLDKNGKPIDLSWLG